MHEPGGDGVRLRRLIGAALAAGAIALAAACGADTEAAPAESLCSPGENIFCRCPGGVAGTKVCNDDGESFSECEFCQERDDSSGASGLGGGPGAGPGAGGGGTGLELLRPCFSGEECQSGLCENNYCTIECGRVSDCEYPISECVPWGGGAVCMPSCKTASDCEVYGAPPSLCGFSPAIDNWTVTVCANWADGHELLPTGTECPPLDHEACNLGYANREVVCGPEGVCAGGCFKEGDCPDGTSCSSPGDELGECR